MIIDNKLLECNNKYGHIWTNERYVTGKLINRKTEKQRNRETARNRESGKQKTEKFLK